MALRLKAEHGTLLMALALGACASQTGDLTTAAVPLQPAETVSRLPSPSGSYQLSQAEMDLDCKKLTGRMAVRIVQVRDFKVRSQSTALSRTIQTAMKPAFGGSGVGTDPDGRHARDLAQLAAYNQRLADKGCANFDLDTALDPNSKDPPRTQRPKKS